MLSDILNVLKFITDSQTRDTMKAIVQVASRKQSNWKENIHSLQGHFSIAEWVKIDAFTNDLFEQIEKTGISQTKYRRFTTVYTELLDNAYYHGCRKESKCQVTLNCIFSKWFIQLEIKDKGKGFNLHDSLETVKKERQDGERNGKSGLEIVMELSDKFEVKKSGIVAVIAGEDRIKTHTTVEKLQGKELLIVTAVEDKDWSFLEPSWESLRDTLEKATESLILVRFGKNRPPDDSGPIMPSQSKEKFFFIEDSHLMRITDRRRKARPVITYCALDKNHYFAYVTPDRWVYDDLKDLETDNLRFFGNSRDAYIWLKECPVKKAD